IRTVTSWRFFTTCQPPSSLPRTRPRPTRAVSHPEDQSQRPHELLARVSHATSQHYPNGRPREQHQHDLRDGVGILDSGDTTSILEALQEPPHQFEILPVIELQG